MGISVCVGPLGGTDFSRPAAQRGRSRGGRQRATADARSPGYLERMDERQSEKGARFRALHEGEPFLVPNPWDAGSARSLEALGFKALATSSSAFAFTLGRLDGEATLDEVVDHVHAVDRATELPLSVDLENGHGPEPEDAAKAIERAAEAGAVGGSIEDLDPDGRIYDVGRAVERVAAAADAARRLDFPFTFTTRSPACRPTRRPVPTSSTRRAWATARRSARFATRPAAPSTCLRTVV